MVDDFDRVKKGEIGEIKLVFVKREEKKEFIYMKKKGEIVYEVDFSDDKKFIIDIGEKERLNIKF